METMLMLYSMHILRSTQVGSPLVNTKIAGYSLVGTAGMAELKMS